MQIVISPSNKPDKKFEARIDGKKQYTLVRNICQTLPYTKTLRGKKGIYKDTLNMKIGQIP